MRLTRILIFGLATLGLVAGVAVATPGQLVSDSALVRRTIAAPFKVKVHRLVELRTKAPIDVVDRNESDEVVELSVTYRLRPASGRASTSRPLPATARSRQQPERQSPAVRAGRAFARSARLRSRLRPPSIRADSLQTCSTRQARTGRAALGTDPCSTS